jgi:6-phosphogluconolactonase
MTTPEPDRPISPPDAAEPRLQVVPDATSAGLAAARVIARALADGVAARGRADWATTGGSTAPAIYRALTDDDELRDLVPWHAVHVWWGDDRFVPRDHPQSNVKVLHDILLDVTTRDVGTAASADRGVPLPLHHLHPFHAAEAIGAGRDAASVARLLAADLADEGLETRDGFPVLDIVVSGVGPDGHVLSVFPDSGAWDETAWAMAIPAPTHVEPHVERITLHPAILHVARHVLIVATGAGKAEIVAHALADGPRDQRRLPAQAARGPNATWILDEAAASRLPR